MPKRFIIIGSIFAILAVVLGAFGAHGLENQLTTEQLQTYKTGVDYQFYHTFGILIVGVLLAQNPKRSLITAGWLFVLGIILFSGSLYLLSTKSITGLDWNFLGPITPLGGTLFIAGWATLLVSYVRENRE